MWRLKIAEGGSPWLRTTNNHAGRQVWEFDPSLGTPEEIEEVERAREAFRESRFEKKNSADLLMRMQFAKENPLEMEYPIIRIQDDEDVTEEALVTSLRKAISIFSTHQAHDGHWPGEFAGPMFFLPGLNRDGGWGFHIEGKSTMFGSTLCYVTLRLLGQGPDDGDGAMEKGREWILDHGSATCTTSWGKIWLSKSLDSCALNSFKCLECLAGLVTTLYHQKCGYCHTLYLFIQTMRLIYSFRYSPNLLDRRRVWCYCRMVYLPMSYIYGKRFTGPITPIILSLRNELFHCPYDQIDWNQACKECAKEDLYYPHPFIQDIVWAFLHKIVEPILMHWPCSKLREKAINTAIQHIHYEDENTRYICMGAVNKVLNMLCVWIEDPNSEAFKLHLPRIYDYLWVVEDGMKMQGCNGSQVWDTAFAVQAIMSTDLSEEFGETLKKAHEFFKSSQILEDCPGDLEFWYRHISKGAWTFATADQGWAVSDCTAGGLKAALLLSKVTPEIVGDPIETKKLYDAVNIILSLMNKDGGVSAWEPTRSYAWLEIFNPAESFGDIMIDYSYVECTTSMIQALTSFKKVYPNHRQDEIDDCINKSAHFLEKTQRDDSSWYGSWGVCFTYGTWFGVAGLLASGRTYENSSCIRKACNFLLSKQLDSGGWGESYLSCVDKVYTNLEGNRVHAVNTSWAMLALIDAGQVSFFMFTNLMRAWIS
ncbi:hypothetical protein ZIOFF_063682 [Zingiber officinale]|uniref:Terpene cyclase/mutase family member n=1 Tax=Zingiber officinale TaxID=94328 RepID=A0A8J5F1X1_ZINOF|nr:hypothetical protein ZIOFF_063682 [Zingiber officinale]